MKFGFYLILLAYCSIAGSIQDDILGLIKNGRADSAIAIAEKKLSNDPGNIFFLNILGRYTMEGQKSNQWLEKAVNSLSDNPQREDMVFQSGQFYFAAGQYTKAAEQFNLYISMFPNGKDLHRAYYWSGISFLNTNSQDSIYIDSAETKFLHLLKSQSPGDIFYAGALEGLAKVRIKREELESAFETVKMALERAPEAIKPGLFYILCQISRRMDDPSAERHFKKKLLEDYSSSLEAQLISAPKPASGVSAKKERNNGFALQLGAYSSLENAQSALEQLKSQKIESYLFPSRKDGQPIFLIHSKIFPDRERAENFGKTTLSSKGISYYIIRKD